MKPIVIYFSGDPFQLGGGATVAYNILKNIKKIDNVTLVTSRYAAVPKEISEIVDIVRVWMPKNRVAIELFDQIIAPFLLMSMRPSRVICLNSILPILYPYRIDLFFQMRMFYFDDLNPASKKIKNILGILSIKRANNVYCASMDHATDLERRLDVPLGKIKVVHLGCEIFGEAQTPALSSRGQDLIFVSVIRPYKNLHGLIEAVIQAKNLRPDLPIRLQVVGEPANYLGIEKYMTDIKKRISHASADKSIKFVGAKSHSEVLALMSISKALIFPTLFEGFGLPLLEAMATKTPVITSSVNSLPEIGGDTVEYFDVSDLQTLVKKIINLYDFGYDSNKLESALGRSKLFCWKRTARAVLLNESFIVK